MRFHQHSYQQPTTRQPDNPRPPPLPSPRHTHTYTLSRITHTHTTQAHRATKVPLSKLSVEEISGFLSMKQLSMFVDKFADLQLNGAKVNEIWKSHANAGVFLQSIAKDVVKRFKALCAQGM
jgi:hypothetical protein